MANELEIYTPNPKFSNDKSQAVIASQLKSYDLAEPKTFELVDQQVLQKRAQASKDLIKTVMDQGDSDASKILNNLLTTVNSIDPGKDDRNFLAKIIKPMKDKVAVIRMQWESAATKIDGMEEELKKRAIMHNEDGKRAVMRMAEIKNVYAQEELVLESLKKFYAQEAARRPEIEASATDDNPMGIRELQRYEDHMRKLQKKCENVHDTLIALSQDMTTQQMTCDNIVSLYSGIHDALFVQLTELRNLYSDTISIERQIRTNKMNNDIKNSTNNMRAKRAELLGQATKEITETEERGSFDLSSFIKHLEVTKNTIVEQRRIREEADKKREEDLANLREKEKEFNEVIRSHGNGNLIGNSL